MGGEPNKNGRHAAVNSFLVLETGQAAEEPEGHVSALDENEPKVSKHRQHCINKMQSRIKLKLEINNLIIVIIATSQKENSNVLTDRVKFRFLDNDGKHEIVIGTASLGKVD